ncbi:lipoprotein N-acyltransferase Lnb domain-containing protein [Flavivirga jejuensis]|uniref:DUF4105 domain-containing protein n=1 Tax=Flavivirga jejuensis TaxID=870487 RepID=A0ABT8WTY0_9FLAO|nr:DUF4105 domain-containing protein [Flavivirga jejuensis]MDO5976641.1 DUF4105 domain-containing protein [Flavivirga jejuensis]
MHKTLFFLFLLFFVEATIGQQKNLSAQTEISVLTIAPGSSLNDAFGHNAFRVKDPLNNLDKTFDYGRFDFEAPNFYLNFSRGKLNYSLGTSNYYDFLSFYIRQNRTVKEQVLNLSQEEKQKLYAFLVNNYKPENRNYLYDFFFDNCATKIKDVANISLSNTIVFNPPMEYKEASFRTLIQNNLNRNSWGSLGIDIALGSVIDKKATAEEHMFLPENIFKFFENASINNNDIPLVKDSRILYSKKETPKPNTFFTSPLFILSIIGGVILFITYQDFKKKKQSVWLDTALFSITGIIGILLLLLWFATDHKGTHQNYNLLWACVLNIFIIRQLFKKKVSTWFIKYLKFLIILLCLLTLHWIIGIQVFAIGLVPLLLALFIRYLYLVSYYNSQ